MVDLEIVNENDEVIGTASREDIHERGLLHREVHVWIYDDDGKILLQRRSAHAGTFPNLLDASVGGHVELGDSYDDTALKEMFEETGIKKSIKDLSLVTKIRKTAHDKELDKINNVFRTIYKYRYQGEELVEEETHGAGFVWVDGAELVNKGPITKEMIPSLIEKEYLLAYRQILSG
jgi:isopentenyldiphosphate isomerase